MLWIEGLTAVIIAAAYLTASFFQFKPAHMAPSPMRVRIGAGIQGLVLGLMIGFLILPLRLSVLAPDGMTPKPGLASLALLPAFVMMLLVRRGALLRTPLLSKYLRAYRRAGLNKTLDDTRTQLEKLDAIEGKLAPA